MLRLENRDGTTIQNPPTGDLVFFNEDGVLKTKDDAGVVEALAVADSTEPKVYVALLTQSGTDAPIATILKNTLGGEVVWSYDGAGSYIGTLIGVFTAKTTGTPLNIISNDDPGYRSYIQIRILGDDSINIKTIDSTTLTDNHDFAIKIEVYP